MYSCIKDIDSIEIEIMNGGGIPEQVEKNAEKDEGVWKANYNPEKKLKS